MMHGQKNISFYTGLDGDASQKTTNIINLFKLASC